MHSRVWPARSLIVTLVLAAIAGCSRSSPPAAVRAPRRVALGFTAEVDPARGTLTILRDSTPAALVQIPDVRDGVPGSGPPNTVELVTEAIAPAVADGCGAGLTSFEGDVRLRSFFAGARLENAHVEILSMSLTGRDACNDATPVPPGTSDTYGLWSYGTLQPSPGAGSHALARWKLKRPDATAFTFSGRVVADIVDDYPPVTQATPGAGTYPTEQLVTLSCADAHVGCASTFYALGGGQPVYEYTGPITLSTTTDLLFYSTDPAGNVEPLQLATFVIDGVPPTVASVVPRDGKANVGLSDPVIVTFSEPLAPGAPVTIVLYREGWPEVAGTVVPQADPAVFHFVPDAPLVAAAEYQVRVLAAGITDVAGNALAADYATRFFTVTPAESMGVGGSATIGAPGIAYDAAGNGLSVWREMTAGGYRMLYAYYSAVPGFWSPPRLLVTEPSTANVAGYMSAKVVSNGTTFLAVWSRLTGLEGAIFTGGAPGTITAFASGNHVQDGFDVASNGVRYAVVAAGTSGNVTATIHNGSGWGTAAYVESSLGTADRPVVAPFGASGFVCAFRLDSTSVYQSRNGGVSWTPATAVPGASGTALVGPVVAASGTRVMVAWASGTGTTQANVDTGTGFAVSATEIGYLSGPPSSLSAAANGNNFAVVWPRYAFGAFGAVFKGTYWGGPYDLAASGKALSAKVAPCSTGFCAAFTIGDSAYTQPSLWLNVASAATGYSWLAANAASVESAAGDVREPAIIPFGTGAALTWSQDDGLEHAVKVRPHDGSTFGTEVTPSLPARFGSARDVKLARSTAGQVMAVWTQETRGGPAVFAAQRSGEQWVMPVLLDLNASSPAIASDGVGFMVAYNRAVADPTNGTMTSNVTARLWTGTGSAWEAPLVVSPDGLAPAIASDGMTYVVAFARGAGGVDGVWSSKWDHAPWSAPAQRSTLAGRFSDVAIAGRTGEYLIVFRKTDSVAAPYAVRGTGSTWEPSYALDTSAAFSGPAIAAGPNGFGAIWGTSLGVTGRVLAGGAWKGGKLLTSTFGSVAIASDGIGYLAAFGATGALKVSAYSDLLGWQVGGVTVGPASTAFALAAGGGEYELITRQADGAAPSLFAINPLRDAALGPERIELAPEPVQTSLALVHDGVDWVAAWTQQSRDDALVDDVQRRWRF